MDEKEKAILELNNKLDTKNTEIGSLTAKVTSHEATIKSFEAKVSELNQKSADQEKEINDLKAQDDQDEDDKVQKNAKIAEQESELNELRKFKQEVVNRDLVTELNTALADFTDAEKALVKDKVETFSANPDKDTIAVIVSEINNEIVKAILTQRKNGAKVNETNSRTAEDIESDIYETNSIEEITNEDLY